MPSSRWKLLVVVLMLCAACRPVPTRPRIFSGPQETSPAGAVRAYAWAASHRDVARLEELTAADFEFSVPQGDSVGGISIDSTYLSLRHRDAFLLAWQHLLRGGPSWAAVRSLNWTVTEPLADFPETTPGSDPATERQLSAISTIEVRGSAILMIQSELRFHVERVPGSASIWRVHALEERAIAHPAQQDLPGPSLANLLLSYR